MTATIAPSEHVAPTNPATAVPAAAARAVAATKRYGKGDTAVTALDEVDVAFESQRFTAIMGPSGSGKSTLMHTVAGLDTLTSGQVFIGDTDLSSLDDRRLTKLRRDQIGFIFQAFNLVPTLTAEENITLPMALAGRKPDPDWFDRVVAHGRPRRPSPPPPERALRRPAAAGRRGPRPGQPAGDHLRRRAHRQPRLPHRRRDPDVHAPGGRASWARPS